MAKSKIPHRNRSPSGWWVFCEVEQWVERSPKKPQKRFPVWENMRLVHARDREQAYRKAIKLANRGRPSETFGGEWRFVGLSMLLPVYDDLEDGAEILWTKRGTISLAKIQKLVRRKEQLDVFDDREP